MSSFRRLAVVIPLLLSPVIASFAFAATKCSVQYEFLANHGDTFWVLERRGADCSGSHLKVLTIYADSVAVQFLPDWKAAPERHLLEKRWTSKPYTRGLSTKLYIPDRGWVIEAPDSVLASEADLYEKRAPRLTGFSAEIIYWDGCGKYLNYGLRDAILDQDRRYLLVITSSQWKTNLVGYGSTSCFPGDGLIVYRITEDR